MNEMRIGGGASDRLCDSISKNKESFCGGLFLSARWFVVSQDAHNGINLIVLPTAEAAEYCASDLCNLTEGDCVFYLPETGRNIEKSNFKSSLEVQRTSAIESICSSDGRKLFIVSYPAALEEKVPEPNRMKEAVLRLKVGEEICHEKIKERLAEMGFSRVDFVSAPGQYALRGAVVDIFSFSFNYPFRLSFFGDEIEKIKIFDCNTQLSKEGREKADIIPDMTEMEGNDDVSITELLPTDSLIWLDSSDMYKESDVFKSLAPFRKVFIDTPLSATDVDPIKFSITPQPVFNKNFELLASDISRKIEENYKVLIYGEKESQLERLKSILFQNKGLIPEFVKGKTIHNGFIDQEERLCCYSDHEIFDRFHRVIIRRTVEKSEQLTLNDLNSFKFGDYIVHIDHGVGIFGGLVRLKDDKGRMQEMVKLMYKDNDVVFVSVHSLHKIARYKSRDSVPPKIHRLGSKAWVTLKSGAKSKIKDIAKELIQLYAKRKASKGYAFSPDTYLQEELESSFMYEDTPDQQKTTSEVKRDMEDNSPMDRLVCGDVGFGKTEIAIRAAFKAVCDNKQVAVLVPTTILALQHYNTFSDRLKGFPCNIESASRRQSTKQISQTQKNLKEGKTDILIGTHKILGAGFEFKDLGLLIIDEEQKFGVSAKEKLRQLREGVDTLTLTATPIPRTLQFSLLGARDLSIINTPPPNRIPVQTEIILFNEEGIRNIINYELKRGGQIFFLHNRVEELPAIEEILHRLVPDMKICVAHGQMRADEMENKMLEFIQGDYDMLLCTTIIENGLDIPNANTIIINQAHNFGLSDLHQLRGRVGRSNRRAFCYLIVPPMTKLTDEARRRLKAIEEFSDIGSGFNIAMQDLDIRGAGNLLGAQQSGFIAEMGYETYQKILNEAMEELGMEGMSAPSQAKGKFAVDCKIETDQPAYIPDTYIDVDSEKIRIYKELDSVVSEQELDRMESRLKDRFGSIPEELDNLLLVVRIRKIGEKLGFEKIIVKNGIMIAFFISNTMNSYYKSDTFSHVIDGVNKNPKDFALKQSGPKLKIVSNGVNSLARALQLLKKL